MIIKERIKRLNFSKIKFKDVESRISRRKNKDKIKRKNTIFKILALCIVCVLAAGGVAGVKTIKKIKANKGLSSNAYMVLKEGKSLEEVYVKGEVDCGEPINISSSFTGGIFTEVNVKIGDEVKAGDILGKIDGSDIQAEIDRLKNSSSADSYKNEKTLEQSRIEYESSLKLLDEDNNSDIIISKGNVKSAENEYNAKKQEYEDWKYRYENNQITQEELDGHKEELDDLKEKLDISRIALENLRYRLKTAYDKAKEAYESAQAQNSSQITSDYTLQEKIKKLEGCVFKSPIDGIVVGVNAQAGRAADGVLFKVLNVTGQTVKIYIRESDIDKLEIGQKVFVSAASGNKESIVGVLTRIESISNVISDKSTYGKKEPVDPQASFVGQVQIDESKDTLENETLVNARIVIEDKSNIYRVPINDVIIDGEDNYVYVAEPQEGGFVVKKSNVTLGKKGHLDLEVSGEDIKEGTIILHNPQNYVPGDILQIKLD